MGKFSIKEKYFTFLLYTVIIVLVNVVGVTLFFRADITRDKIYSLSSASKDAVATLSDPLSIKVFFSKDLPAPHNNTERYLKDLLEEYAARGGKYFNYTFYNVSPEEGSLTRKTDENRDLARDYGIQPVQIRVIENDEVKFKNAYMGLVIIHGDLIEKIETITSTDGIEYQLTTAIQKLNNKVSALLRIKEKVGVNMYLSSSLNTIAPLINLDQLPLLDKVVSDTINKLNTRSLGVIELKKFDLSEKKELDALGKKHDVMALSWPAIPDKGVKEGHGAAGLVIEFKDQTATLPLISVVELPIIGTTYQMVDPAMLEEDLNAIVEKMIGINRDIGFLSDHGTQTLMPDRLAMMQGRPGGGMQTFNGLISSRYSIKPVGLKEGNIPDALSCLIIAKPTEKFSDYELFQIDQALMKGTSLAVIGDAFQEIIPPQQGGMGAPPRHEPIDTGLEKLLAHYGVTIKKAYVLDKECYQHQQSQNMGGGEQAIYFAPMLEEKSINNTPVFMDNIKGLVAMQISPLELLEDNIDREKINVVKLLSSSEESWLMEGMINLNPMFLTPPESQDKMKSYDLSLLLEGTFTSYFKGKAIPEKEMGEKDIKDTEKQNETAEENADTPKTMEGVKSDHAFLETSKPAKLFVLPCSQMLQDNMLDPQGRSTNSTFILNIIDHLNGEDDITRLRSKQQRLNPVAETTPFERGLMKTFNIIGLPILIILFGLGVLAKRSARKKKITRRFNA